ncbi:serine hydrolase domain-containing protein [Pseudonocardia oroxyli]|uniref:CubicO group peptidase, beta-lactamase class C family n=1 Tax=Pseudonocardia oroxyli TaxID=366584 RepID=A0A1G7TUM1_PSEOR|nr:serine hydrolase domain-containing protein [Pseudonocardia oroxyli]SDG38861.1 CubicO group peptidase, beta-lactamase class C family [Pseudonocardia oroxyli]
MTNQDLDSKVTDLEGEIDAALAVARERGEVGLQVTAYLHGEQVVDAWTGTADKAGRVPVDGSTLFPAFSVTKGITATALHLQAERGLVDYEAPVVRYWPEFGQNGKEKATVRDVLSHRSGVPQMPAEVTTERMADWDWMVTALAAETPLFPPGEVNCYHSINWGWLVGEIVRRTDPVDRSFGQFVQDELCAPLGIEDLFIGLPEKEDGRVAELVDDTAFTRTSGAGRTPLQRRTMPAAAAPTAEIFGRTDVWRAQIPGAGGIMNARSAARVYAMIACGGRLGDVRMLSEERLRAQLQPRPDADKPDLVSGVPRMLGIGGYYVGGQAPPANALYAGSTSILGHPGAGSSNAWADLDSGLAVALIHNRMFDEPPNRDDHPFIPIVEVLQRFARQHG